jgi:hypothetical protein
VLDEPELEDVVVAFVEVVVAFVVVGAPVVVVTGGGDDCG